MRTPSRLVASTLLLILALGGASLAVAADSTNLEQAVQQPATMGTPPTAPDLTALDAATADLVQAARDGAGNLQALNLDATRAALSRGDAASDDVSAAILALGTAAPASASVMQDTWSHLHAQTSAVVALLANLQAHDSAVVSATAAGRSGSWESALDDLSDASAWLAQARTTRSVLGDVAAADTLGQLIGRDATYDDALSALYAFLAKGHAQSGRKFTALSAGVTEAQLALPASTDVLSFIVGSSAEATLTADLLGLERARADVLAASASASAPAPGAQ